MLVIAVEIGLSSSDFVTNPSVDHSFCSRSICRGVMILEAESPDERDNVEQIDSTD